MVTIKLLIVNLLITFSLLSAADVEISIYPETFRVGERAELSITINNGRLEAIPRPADLDGITFRSTGTQRSFRSINGSATSSITQNYAVIANEVGEYTIDSIDIQVDGKTIKSEPVTFKVVAALPNQSPATADSETGPGFLKLDFFDRKAESLYVGEMAPIRLRAYFPRDSQLSRITPIKPVGSGFTLHNLSERPKESNEIVDGESYVVYTWYAGISFARTGELPIKLSMDATVLIPDKSRPKRRRSGDSLFDHFFSDDFFGSTRIPKEYTLESTSEMITVIPLPTEGRPANFDGAVGSFNIEGYSLPVDGNTGEPQSIHITVNGKGNFDRLNAPILEPKESWKTYTPKTEFEPADVISFAGKKTFRFNAIPQQSGTMNLSLGFSYFDPETKQYHQRKTTVVEALISGESITTKPAITASSNQPQEKQAAKLAADRTIRKGGSTLEPMIRKPMFWVLLNIIIFSAIAWTTWQWLQQRKHSPKAIANRKAQNQANATQAEIDAAERAKDPKEFFSRAQSAIKQQAAAIWGINPSAITLADLKRRLPEDSPVLKVFAKCDAITYGGSLDSDESLPTWQSTFREAMQSLAEQK